MIASTMGISGWVLLLSGVLFYTHMVDSVQRPYSARLQEQGRVYLVYPYTPYGTPQSFLEFIFGCGLPMDLPHPYGVLMSIEFRMDHLFPVNASDWLYPTDRRDAIQAQADADAAAAAAAAAGGSTGRMVKRDTSSDLTRWKIYHVLEMAANSIGMDGRAFVLKSICEAAATPVDHHGNGIIGQLLHVLLTPSSTDESDGRYLDAEYRSAERLGSDLENNCSQLYPESEYSLLDIVTKLHL